MRLDSVVAALVCGVIVLFSPADARSATGDDRSIRPFKAQVPQAALDELRGRIAATRWPDKEAVADATQGPQLARLQELVRYWGSGYDWRKVEAQLNALPQFTTPSTAWTSTSSTSAPATRTPFPSSSRTAGRDR
jgi:hypothetical protein